MLGSLGFIFPLPAKMAVCLTSLLPSVCGSDAGLEGTRGWQPCWAR